MSGGDTAIPRRQDRALTVYVANAGVDLEARGLSSPSLIALFSGVGFGGLSPHTPQPSMFWCEPVNFEGLVLEVL